MNSLRYFIGKVRLRVRGKNRIVGWSMSPEQARGFFSARRKTVLTLVGFSGKHYESETALLQTVSEILLEYSPESTLVNIGGTEEGIGAAYPVAKSLRFTTTAIVSSRVLQEGSKISDAVDYVCFIADEQWGGKLPDSDELSPTSKAIVMCSDVMIGIGGSEIAREELVAGQKQGKPVYFYPAEMNHAEAIQRAAQAGQPQPKTFWGEAHEVFGKQSL